MKRKISKILGVGVVVALLASLVLAAAPVSALAQPTVTPASTTISGATNYTILTSLAVEVLEGGKIAIVFPTGTTISSVVAADITIAGSSGIGSSAFVATAAVTAVVSSQTLTVTVPDVNAENKIGAGALVQIVIGNSHIVNPATAGSYTLTVGTLTSADVVIEAAVTSAAYTIVVPTISPLPGIVYVYNSAGILMTQKTGTTAIADAITASVGLTTPTIKIGPGTYTENPNTAVVGTIFVATGTAAETIIKGTFTIDVATTTLDKLTITGNVVTTTATTGIIKDCVFVTSAVAAEMLDIDAASTPFTVQNSTFGATGTTITTGIDVNGAASVTITGSTFTLDAGATGIDTDATALTASTNIFTGAGAAGISINAGTATLTSCTFDGLVMAIDINGGTVSVSKSTVKNSTGDAINVDAATKVTLTGNDINTTAATKYGVIAQVGADAENIFVLFNNINNTLNVKNLDTTNILNATHNYWGAATGPASTSISTAALVSTTPYLTGAVTVGAGAIANTSATLTGKTTAKVDVSIVTTAGVASPAGVIGAANYAANPGAATPYTALAGGFYDVYVSAPANTTDVVTMLLYNATVADTTQVYVWSPLAGKWAKCTTQGANTVSGYAYVTVSGATTTPSLTDMTGTVFALVTVPAAAPTLPTPVLTVPVTGTQGVALQPTFAWAPVTGAVAYYFDLADNPNFVLPVMTMTGDQGRLIATAYHHMIDLDYSTSYYWRVSAVSGTVALKNLVQGPWAYGIFITEAEPVVEEPAAPVWTCPQDGLTFDSREALAAHAASAHPPVEPIIFPAEEVITPAWIYAIIGVGAVLVISVIVLIARTRRVS